MSIWKKKWKNKKKSACFLSAAILLFLAGMAVYTVFIRPGRDGEKYIYIEENVRKGDLVLGIMESGGIDLEESTLDYTLELDADEEEDGEEEEEDGESGGYLEIEEVYVVKGQRIEEGDVLFKLTDKSVAAVKRKTDTLFIEAQIALAEAETEYEIGKLQAKSVYDTSMLEAERAESSYGTAASKSREGVSGLSAEQKALEAEIEYYTEKLADEELWESLEDAEEAYAAAKSKYEDTDYHNATAYTDNYSQYKSAKEQLEKVQEQIDEYNRAVETDRKKIEENQRKKETAEDTLAIEELTNESAYKSAVLGGELAEDIYNYTISALEETVNIARSEMEEAEENKKELDAFVGGDGMIYADGAGLVTNVYYNEGDKLKAAGAMISYAKENAYTVTVDVSEEDIAAVKIGDTVDVVMTAYPDQAYEGTVVSVSTATAEEYALTVNYPVVVRIEGDTSLLYGGMTAEVTFVADSVRDVLYVSKKAVQEIDGKSYVYRKGSGGKRELAEVETGFSDGANVEITEGLSEDDVVYIESKVNAAESELMEQREDEDRNAGKGGEEGEEMPGNRNGIGMPDMEKMSDGESGQEMPGNGGKLPEGAGMPDMGGIGDGGR